MHSTFPCATLGSGIAQRKLNDANIYRLELNAPNANIYTSFDFFFYKNAISLLCKNSEGSVFVVTGFTEIKSQGARSKIKASSTI